MCKARAAAAHQVMPSPQSPPYTAETAAAKKKELAGSNAGDRCAPPLSAVRVLLATLAASSNPIQLTSKCAGERRELLHGNYSDTNRTSLPPAATAMLYD